MEREARKVQAKEHTDKTMEEVALSNAKTPKDNRIRDSGK